MQNKNEIGEIEHKNLKFHLIAQDILEAHKAISNETFFIKITLVSSELFTCNS